MMATRLTVKDKHKLAVYGYIRSIIKDDDMIIPTEIQNVIFVFYFINIISKILNDKLDCPI